MSATRCHTFTGSGFDPFCPRAEDVRLEDIAHHLAMTCRFGGATPEHYSVAQHAVRVARLAYIASGNPLWTLFALHHDDAEAYIHDLRRPIKQRVWISRGHSDDEDGRTVCDPFEGLEDDVLGAIFRKLFTPQQIDEEGKIRGLIKDCDNAMLNAEMIGLLEDDPGIPSPYRWEPILPSDCLDWRAAEAAFLATHYDLVEAVKAAR